MSDLLNRARDLFIRSRRSGNTDCAVDACRIHSEAYLVVVNHQRAQSVLQQYPELKGRIVCLTDHTYYGLQGPLVWDTEAVHYLIEQINHDLRVQFAEVTGFHATGH